MWLFTRFGFFSATCARAADGKGAVDPDIIQIRARVRNHLENLKHFADELLENAKILDFLHTDYRYRIIIPKETWATVASMLAQDTDFGNFKSACHRELESTGADYVHALHNVWDIMYRLQK